MPIAHHIQTYIETHNMLQQGDSVIVGVSAGADSVALLQLLHHLGYRCMVAHCNFRLRAAESDGDALFVAQLAAQLGVPYLSESFNTEEVSRQEGISIEMAARTLRYQWFEQLRVQYQAAAIAIAHHQDDSIETLFLNLIRGTGIDGLTGISAVNGFVIRPLLTLSRAQILDYLSAIGQPYRTDSTNMQTLYKRNKIRLELLPLLQTINPSVQRSLLTTMSHLSQTALIYHHYLESCRHLLVASSQPDHYTIHIESLRATASPEAVLYDLLQPLGFSSATIQDIATTITTRYSVGISYLSATHRVVVDRDKLLLTPYPLEPSADTYLIEATTDQIRIPISLEFSRVGVGSFARSATAQLVQIDSDKLLFPLELRRWRPGDSFIPLGMSGRKKVSDLLTDRKISRVDKEQVWLLLSQGHIVWVVGYQLDNRYKITPSTQNILQIEKKER